MEIITYVREGAVTHKDSLGNEGRTEAGDVQVMSAGTGIRHAEYNMEQQPTRIFQILITPSANGGSPVWGSQPFPKADRSGRAEANEPRGAVFQFTLPSAEKELMNSLQPSHQTGEPLEYTISGAPHQPAWEGNIRLRRSRRGTEGRHRSMQ